MTFSIPILLSALVAVDVESQHLDVALDPADHQAVVVSTIRARGAGTLRLDLTDLAEIRTLRLDGRDLTARRGAEGRLEIEVPRGGGELTIGYMARFEQDVEAGERPGQIHNFAVDAHVGENGIFLADGAAWHPRPIADDGHPALHRISAEIAPIDGWAMVASGDPLEESGTATGPAAARWRWAMPRPVDGMSIVGNRHQLTGRVHETAHGPVEVVMHVPDEHAELAPMFVDAACAYLDLYVPLLGAFPYRRFSIVENFFSSGFAFPGFTVLGPQVVGMAPRSLAPGYLDHELLHNWWGNGVYVDPADGNWCEAMTSFGANYYRRIADDGPTAGRAYRRGILMKVSTDPHFMDDGPLGDFGSADPSTPGPDRFVGYDKGAFVFAMLGDAVADVAGDGVTPEEAAWASLRRFAGAHLGGRADWTDIQAAFEAGAPNEEAGWLDGFFEFWVRGHGRPHTTPVTPPEAHHFTGQFPAAIRQRVHIERGLGDTWFEIDPEFRMYRILPPGQIVPTIAGTTGKGGVVAVGDPSRPEVAAYLPQVEADDDGENLLLIGADSVRAHADLVARASDPIEIRAGSFAVGGASYDEPGQAVLHTMQHPDRPGRFITVFHSNGEAGWSRLRLIRFYSRDTTIVWADGRVIERRVFEPERRLGGE